MKVGSRGDYGLRAAVFLARQEDMAAPVQVHAIAETQQIPEDYLRQLLVSLRLAGLVRSVRGPHGGYLLARAPEAISMGEVLEVLEGVTEVMPCKHLDSGAERCELIGGCEIRAMWRRAAEAQRQALHGTSLRELAARA
jgi:Rrf2 family protein